MYHKSLNSNWAYEIWQDWDIQLLFTFLLFTLIDLNFRSCNYRLTIVLFVIFLHFSYILILKITKVCKFSKLARDYFFNAGDKKSFDMGLGGSKGHMVRFLFNSVHYFLKLTPLILTPKNLAYFPACSLAHSGSQKKP